MESSFKMLRDIDLKSVKMGLEDLKSDLDQEKLVVAKALPDIEELEKEIKNEIAARLNEMSEIRQKIEIDLDVMFILF